MNESYNQASIERDALFNMVNHHFKAQQSAKRWGIFFKLCFLALSVYFVAWPMYMVKRELGQTLGSPKSHTALINIRGEIESSKQNSADSIISALEDAYASKMVKGIVLRINSPGGSPVQARQIFDAMQALRAEHPEVKIYAAIEDIGTSAAYLIATAADEIYADKTSIVGSIGALINSFGFTELMQKVGVERRLYTAGSLKGMLDPFSAKSSEQEAIINSQLAEVHQAFINNVQSGRGKRLTMSPEISSGRFWTGDKALTLGLIDGHKSMRNIAKDIIKETNIIDYSNTTGLLDKLSSKIGANLSESFANKIGLDFGGLR